jgi:hypothetical protein
MSQEPIKSPEKTKKRKGCFFWGCLSTIGILVVAALIIGIFVFKVPQKIGLVKPASERLLSQTPDRETALKVKADFQKAGLNTTGVDIYVFPEKNSDKSVLLTVLDTSKGFRFPASGSTDAVSDYLVKLANTGSANGINRVAFEYRDADGNSLVSITAATDAILKYSRGQMSRSDFLKAIDAKLDISEVATSGLP